MEIKALEKSNDKNKASFFIKDSNVAYVNSIRRIMTEEVPTLAIEDVELKNNSSVLYDEMIAHRLGLVVLKTDPKSYVLPEKCSCKGEGCARCQLKITLKVKGPCTVYASDLKSKDPKVKPVYPKTIIAKLSKDQELEFEATAVMGQGKEHAKWSPGLFYYKHKTSISTDSSKLDEESAKRAATLCPVGVFEAKGNKLSVKKDSEIKCHLCEACTDEYPDAIKVTPIKDQFIFFMESWGSLSCKEIADAALTMSNAHLNEFADLVKKAK